MGKLDSGEVGLGEGYLKICNFLRQLSEICEKLNFFIDPL